MLKFLFSFQSPTGIVRITVGAPSVEQADRAVRQLYPQAVFLGIVAAETPSPLS